MAKSELIQNLEVLAAKSGLLTKVEKHSKLYEFHNQVAKLAANKIKADTGHNRLFASKGKPHLEVKSHPLFSNWVKHNRLAETHHDIWVAHSSKVTPKMLLQK